jgi:hypothetical protein
MQCPLCDQLARLCKKVELGGGQVYRVYRCQRDGCGHRFTTMEEYQAATPGSGGFRSSKITAEDAAEIKALVLQGQLSKQEIANRYMVSRPLVSRIAHGHLWRGIQPAPLDKIRSRA